MISLNSHKFRISARIIDVIGGVRPGCTRCSPPHPRCSSSGCTTVRVQADLEHPWCWVQEGTGVAWYLRYRYRDLPRASVHGAQRYSRVSVPSVLGTRMVRANIFMKETTFISLDNVTFWTHIMFVLDMRLC